MRKPPPIVLPAYAVLRFKRVNLGIKLEDAARILGEELTAYIDCERGLRPFPYPKADMDRLVAALQLTPQEREGLEHYHPPFTNINPKIIDCETGGKMKAKGRQVRKVKGANAPPKIWVNPSA